MEISDSPSPCHWRRSGSTSSRLNRAAVDIRINSTPARISPIAANKITAASTIPGSRVFMAKFSAIRRTTSDPPISPHPANSRTQKNIAITPASEWFYQHSPPALSVAHTQLSPPDSRRTVLLPPSTIRKYTGRLRSSDSLSHFQRYSVTTSRSPGPDSSRPMCPLHVVADNSGIALSESDRFEPPSAPHTVPHEYVCSWEIDSKK
jgi:hypothetical protein